MWIQVRTMDGKVAHTVDSLSRLTKVEELRKKIQELFHVEPGLQRLFYRGKQLLVRQSLVLPAPSGGGTGGGSKERDSELSDTDSGCCLAQSESDKSSNSGEAAAEPEGKADEDEWDETELGLYKAGEYVDARDTNMGAWFEAKVIRVTRKVPAQDEPCSSTSSPKPEDNIVYHDLEVGQMVMVNYNPDNPKDRGFWYDAEILRKRETRTVRELHANVRIGDDSLNDCRIIFVDEVFKIERPGEGNPMVENPTRSEFRSRPSAVGGQGARRGGVVPELTPSSRVQGRAGPPASTARTTSGGRAALEESGAGSKGGSEEGRRAAAGPGGATYFSVSESGVHRPHVAGIHGRSNDGAYSLVLAGGYEDDVDHGNSFTYTGSGGRDLSGNKRTAEQSCDQKLTNTNRFAESSVPVSSPAHYPEGYLEALARREKEKENSKRAALEKEEDGEEGFPSPRKGKRKSKLAGGDGSSRGAPKKTKVEPYSLTTQQSNLIKEDKSNTKLWTEILKSLKDGPKFLSKVEEAFQCICCQELVFRPITTVCQHTVC
ncbi:hypothetical protein E2I00_009834, partial [Balaenoptera physalus]